MTSKEINEKGHLLNIEIAGLLKKIEYKLAEIARWKALAAQFPRSVGKLRSSAKVAKKEVGVMRRKLENKKAEFIALKAMMQEAEQMEAKE